MIDDFLYYYRATVKRWVDGDTVELVVDLGFTVKVEITSRLWGIDTPERGQDGYREATAKAESLAPVGTVVAMESLGRDKYGRWLAKLWGSEPVNQTLIETGHAVVYDGGKRSGS